MLNYVCNKQRQLIAISMLSLYMYFLLTENKYHSMDTTVRRYNYNGITQKYFEM